MKYECPIFLPSQTADREHRYLSRVPSPEMQAIERIEPAIFQESRGGRCYRTPGNFVGALLVHEYQEKFAQIFENRGVAIPSVVIKPIEVLPDIPIYYYETKAQTYQPSHLTAPKVLIKYASGFTSGVVIQGPLAGLLLERREDTHDLHEGMYVGRVFNDDTDVHRAERPYTPLQYTDADLNLNDISSLRTGCRAAMETAFTNLVNRLGHENYSTVNLFFAQCERVGVNVDTEAFHFTRPAS